MSEANLTRRVAAWLEKQPDIFVEKKHGSRFGKRGIPDFIGCCRGLYFGLELKDEGEKLTDIQKYRIRQIQEAGGQACGVWTIEEAQELISELRRVDEKSLKIQWKPVPKLS